MTSLTIVLLMLSLQAVMGIGLKDLEEPIKKCSIPRKFEGKIKLSMKVGPHQVQFATGSGTIHADDKIGKLANLEKIVSHGQTTEINTYISNNITYTALPATATCHQGPGMPIIPGKVPPGFTLHVTRGVLHGVHVQIWEFSPKPGMGEGSSRLYLTEDKCMPMKIEIKATVSGQKIYTVEDYIDMKEGIKDASVFNLPKCCLRWSYYGNSYRLPHSPTMHILHAIARLEMRSQILA